MSYVATRWEGFLTLGGKSRCARFRFVSDQGFVCFFPTRGSAVDSVRMYSIIVSYSIIRLKKLAVGIQSGVA